MRVSPVEFYWKPAVVPNDIPPKLKLFATSLAISLFRVLRMVKRGLQNLFQRLGRVLSPIGRFVVRFFVLPIYRLGVTTRLKINRLALPARGVALFLLTNRYLLHATLILVAVSVIAANLQSNQAHAQDIGQKSILFALATDAQNEVTEEPVNTESTPKSTSYLAGATITGVPHVDFDYDVNADPVTPSISVPGTIAAAPYTVPSETNDQTAPRTKIENYTVQADDTIGSIAQHFGVNVGTILWNNNLTEREYIRPGDTLVIPPVSGLIVKVKKGDTLSKLASKYNADATEVADVNQLQENATLSEGMSIVIPGGSPPAIQQTHDQIAYYTAPTPTPAPTPKPKPTVATAQPTPAPSTASQDVETGDESIPTTAPPRPPDATTNLPAGRLLWPTSGHVITQYYGWQHTGVDIDGDYTSPIYAADDGIVETAGWNSGGYGLMILIDHPNGLKTRYGHTSKLFVKVGDHVKRGQVIAMMGTTGRSTGTHLHFEVYVGNTRTNPLAYIK